MAYEIILGRTKHQREKYGIHGTIFLGKHYVQMGQTVSLASSLQLDVAGPHVILVSGKRGSGKSYTLGVIGEGLVGLPEEMAKNLSCILFDTMGIYWTMKFPNYRDDKLLKDWDLEPKKLKPVVFVPIGLFEDYKKRKINVDKPFAIRPQDVGVEAWSKIFDIDLNSEEGILLERILKKLENKDFSIPDILLDISVDKKSSPKERTILENRFTSAQGWGVFDKKGTELKELFVGGQATVLDLSAYTQVERGSHIKALVIGLVCDQVLKQRLIARKDEEVKLIEEGAFLTKGAAFAGEKEPLIWMLIDEAHEFIPNKGETLASKPLIQILREGRQPGITLVLATQQPGSIAMDALTQADIVISHRLTSKMDVGALSDVMQTYLPFALTKYIDDLPAQKGSAIVLDDKLEKIYPIQVRPRASWHGGEDPTAIPKSMIKEIEAEKKEKK